MAREVTKKYKLGRSIQKGGYTWRLTGEGEPTSGSPSQLRLLDDINAPIGSEYLDLVTGVKYVKIDTTPDAAGAYKVGEWDTTSDQSNSSSGMEFTGGFAGKPASNQYAWQNGVGINITQADVNAERFKTFSFDSTIQVAVDNPYWSDPTPADHTGKGVFGGSYLPEGVTNVFDYTTVDSDTYEDGSNIVTTGGLDFSQ